MFTVIFLLSFDNNQKVWYNSHIQERKSGDYMFKDYDVKIFAKTYDNKVIEQIETMLDTGIFDNKKVRIMPDCLTEDTEVLTTNGFKLIKDITKDDLIANYDWI